GHQDHRLKLYGSRFRRSMRLRRRGQLPQDIFGFRTPSGRDQARWFLRVVRQLSSGYFREFADVDIYYPFTHRPLVEFMQAIPFEQRVRPGQARSLLRRALAGLLPAGISSRKGKTLNTEAALLGLFREGPRLQEMFTNAHICRLGYVDHRRLQEAV